MAENILLADYYILIMICKRQKVKLQKIEFRVLYIGYVLPILFSHKKINNPNHQDRKRMEAICSKHLMTSLVIILASSLTLSQGAKKGSDSERPYQEASTVFIRTSCSSTTYPRLCYSSLVKHADLIQTNRVVLTGAALNVTLASVKSTSAMMSTLAKKQGLKPREVAAMQDCVEQLSDTVDELRRSIAEMSDLRASNFEMIMSDVQTWVSAALTDETTCNDGFQEITAATDIKSTVRRLVIQVAQLTSNALALINKLANS